MVKAKATTPDGRVLIVMGISEDNVLRLERGLPIHFDPAALRIAPGTTIGGITLFYGTTDAELVRTLKTLIGPRTDVVVIPHGDEHAQ